MTDETPEIKLTGKQKRFADEYVICLNATEAARRAGYDSDARSLAAIGSENLRKPNIRAYIDGLLEAQNLSRQEILGRLADHARSDMGDFIDATTMSIDWKHAKELGITHLIKKAKVTTTTILNKDEEKEIQTLEFELHDAQAALVHLGRAQALFTDKQQIDGTMQLTWKEAVEQARKEAGDQSSVSTD